MNEVLQRIPGSEDIIVINLGSKTTGYKWVLNLVMGATSFHVQSEIRTDGSEVSTKTNRRQLQFIGFLFWAKYTLRWFEHFIARYDSFAVLAMEINVEGHKNSCYENIYKSRRSSHMRCIMRIDHIWLEM